MKKIVFQILLTSPIYIANNNIVKFFHTIQNQNIKKNINIYIKLNQLIIIITYKIIFFKRHSQMKLIWM